MTQVVVQPIAGFDAAAERRMLADPEMQRCHNPRSLDDVLCCYGACAPAPAATTTRRNEMCATCEQAAATADQVKNLRRQLEQQERNAALDAARRRFAEEDAAEKRALDEATAVRLGLPVEQLL